MSPSSFRKYPCRSWHSLRQLSVSAVASSRCQRLALLMVSLNKDYTVRLLYSFINGPSASKFSQMDRHQGNYHPLLYIHIYFQNQKSNVPISPSFPSSHGDTQVFSSFQGLLSSTWVILITVADSRCKGAAHWGSVGCAYWGSCGPRDPGFFQLGVVKLSQNSSGCQCQLSHHTANSGLSFNTRE